MQRLIFCFLLLLAISQISACAMSNKSREMVRPVTLSMPDDYRMAAYLGFFAPAQSFRLTDIKARLLVAEVFQTSCSHCLNQVDDLKELYELISNAGLFHQVKFIGLGYGEGLFEVESFGQRYAIPFPLFADPRGCKVKVESIPATFILELTPGGARVLYEFHGLLPSADDLLQLIRQSLDL